MPVFPPNTPPLDPAPVRTPVSAAGGSVTFKDNRQWQPFFNLLFAAIRDLQSRPVSLSGLAADIPDATQYPENSRYWATDTTTESINIFATPGDHTTASWVAM